MRLNSFLVLAFFFIVTLCSFSQLSAADLLRGDSATNLQSSETKKSSTNSEVSVLDQFAAWIWTKQREFHRKLTAELRQLRGNDGVGWTLVLMSFLYGVFHAAGPGHGKAVLTTYLLTHQNEINRGIVMGAAAAMMQGVTALVLVYGLIGLAGWLPRETQTASLWVTRVSFILLASIGLYLLIRSALGFVKNYQHWQRQKNALAHDHHHHEHAHGESCGCKHVPDMSEIQKAVNWREIIAVVMAIGLRPCTGAVLVLILASVMNLAWHGVFAVIAMSLGTAITVILLAVFAVKARQWASALVNHSSVFWTLVADGVGALGGTLILLFGFWLFYTSYTMKAILGF